MKTLYAHKASNISKTWFLLAAFFGFIIALGYVLSIFMDAPGILIASTGFAVVSSIGSYWFSDKLVLKMTGAKEVSRENMRELYTIVENLAIAAGMPMPRIFVINDQALNAFATGRDPKHGVVVFTRGLLERLNKEEIRGVAAHELSHIANRDMLVSTIAVIFASVIAFASRMIYFGGGSRDRGGGAIALVAIVLLVIAPLIATLLRLAVSRKREFLADASGALLTRYPEGLASALEKIGSDAKPLDRASNATAHLFISNPFKGKGKSVMKFFMTHPPIEERVARLRSTDVDHATQQ